MNYIYDINLNFNDVYYEQFEWNKGDKIKRIKKIPIIKISETDFIKIYNYNFKIDKDIFDKIKSKTETYNNRNKLYAYCLFSSDNNVLAIKFDKFGNSKQISSLCVEDELDIIEGIKISKKKINFTLKEKRKKYYQTRYERKSKIYITNQLNKLDIKNDKDKINYIYYECFNELNNNTNESLEKIKFYLTHNNPNENLKYFLNLYNKN